MASKKKTYLDLGLPCPSCGLLGGEVVGQGLVLLHLDVGCWTIVGGVMLLLLLLLLMPRPVLEGRRVAVVKEIGSSGLMVLM